MIVSLAINPHSGNNVLDEPALFCGVSRLNWFEPSIASLVGGSGCSAEVEDVEDIFTGADVFNERIPNEKEEKVWLRLNEAIDPVYAYHAELVELVRSALRK